MAKAEDAKNQENAESPTSSDIQHPSGSRNEPRPIFPSGGLSGGIQQLTAMFAGQVSRPTSLLDKLDPEGVKQLLKQSEKSDEREHHRQMRSMNLTAVMIGVSFLVIFALCLLFLAYGKSEQVDKIITLIAGLIGGFGVGRATASKKVPANE